jgi:integrase/recombinase XerD
MTQLSSTIADYLTDCRARGLSLKTVQANYGWALLQVFQPWCDRQGITSLSEIDNRAVMRWQADLLNEPGRRGRPISRYSIQGWVKAVNSFLKWAKSEGEMDHEAKGRAPRPPKVLLEVLSRDQIEQLEHAAQTERDKLIIRILADTGIRASELIGLRVSDLIERDRQYFLRVRGKGNKERLVPVPRLGLRITRFIRGRDGRMFVTLRRLRGERAPLTVSGLQQVVRGWAREIGMTQRVHPHLFRHSYATYALQKGMNPIQLADILGHTSLVMIQRNYAHLSSRDAYDAAARLLAD